MDKNFFNFETSEKYYGIGWILSDGHIRKNQPIWVIQLNIKDRMMLVKILKLLESDAKIYGPYGKSNGCAIEIRCREHYEFLTQIWGLDNHKSQTLKWVDVPEEFLPHLCRGYFDGDGSIYVKQSANPNVDTVGINFVGTHHFINGLRLAINKANNLPNNAGHIADLDTYVCLCYNGCEMALKILDWMYEDSTELTRLERKFEKYINYKVNIEVKTKHSLSNKSIKYAETIIPDHKMANKIRFDYANLGYTINELSKKYDVNSSVISPIIQNITHIRTDNRNANAKFDITAFGETHHALDWINDDRCNVDLGTLRDRIINQKLNPEEALVKLPDSTSGVLKYKYEIDGEEKTISEILKDKGISRSAFVHRIHNLSMDPKEASEKLPGEIPHRNHTIDINSNNQKYTIEQVNEARSLHQRGWTVISIAQKLNMTESALYDIVSGRSFNDLNYEPNRKKSDTICITYGSQTLTIQQWADQTGIPYSTIDRRYRANLPLDQVFHTGEKRLNLGKTQSERNMKAKETAYNVRLDYSNGIIGKVNYERWGIPKSRYIDLIGNRTCKEDTVWWKN